jgi:hypothetical protein
MDEFTKALSKAWGEIWNANTALFGLILSLSIFAFAKIYGISLKDNSVLLCTEIMLVATGVTRALIAFKIYNILLRLPRFCDIIFWWNAHTRRQIAAYKYCRYSNYLNFDTSISCILKIQNHLVIKVNLLELLYMASTDLSFKYEYKGIVNIWKGNVIREFLSVYKKHYLEVFQGRDINDIFIDLRHNESLMKTLEEFIRIYKEYGFFKISEGGEVMFAPVIVRQLDIERFGYWWGGHEKVGRFYKFCKLSFWAVYLGCLLFY